MKTDQAKDIIDKHIDHLAENLDSGHCEQLTECLSTMAKFHRYSLGNVLLIMAQKPDATHAAGLNYIQLYRCDRAQLTQSLDAVRKAASLILEAII